MISQLVALISLNLTLNLVTQYGVVAKTYPVSGATTTTPIVLESLGHNVPLGRQLHGVVTGIQGTEEANGLWILTPVDGNTFSLSTLSPQGIPTPSAGTNAYVSGGQIQVAFPDGRILLGRRNVAMQSAVAVPRIVFVPTVGRAWGFEPYGGLGAAPPQERGSLEQQSEKLAPQAGTEFPTFEVYITAAADPPDPDAGDFDAVQQIAFALSLALWDMVADRCVVKEERWPSQTIQAGSQTQRGQQMRLILELQQPIALFPEQFVPIGTSLVFTVEPENPLIPDDQTTFTVNPEVV